MNYPKEPGWSVFVFYLLRGVRILKPEGFCQQYTVDETELCALPKSLYSGSEGLELFQFLCFTDKETNSKSLKKKKITGSQLKAST